ncbi:MAG: deoxyribodipyrimidine photo-lyase [Chlamydiae bacterium]|nr:deoxyribodipyrimidine photo-lyase [Chlamydiota bacterium]
MSSIVWFRQDLRLEDHYPLLLAIEAGRPLVLVFILEKTKHWSIGRASQWWLEQSLLAFKESIEAKGGFLHLFHGETEEILETLIRKHKAEALYYGANYEPEERKIESRVEALCKRYGIASHKFHHNLLYNPETVLTKEGKPYQVYTPFWNRTQQFQAPEEPMPAPRSLSCCLKGASEPISKLHLTQTWDLHQIPLLWEPGEKGAKKRLKTFIDKGRVEDYEHDRNFPAIDGSSKLSPHLHHGEISPRVAWHSAKASLTYRKELVWREFAKHLLYHFPHTTDHPLKPEFDAFPWQKNAKLLKAWQNGETGFPIVDAGMKELKYTGWMHNRVRMIVGSFLIKDLRIHWLEGAKWFWDCLVDADLASNTLGWQWVGGCGADAAPFFRIFHPDLQEAKFDPTHEYIKKWVKEPSKRIVDHAEARDEALKAYHSIVAHRKK